MTISCGCDGDYDWYYEMAKDYSSSPKNRRCFDCNRTIKKGDLFLDGYSYEMDEEGAYEINHKPLCLCERCADIYFNLTELKYCISFEHRGSKGLQLDLAMHIDMHNPRKDLRINI